MKSTIANPSIVAVAFGQFNERFENFKKEASKKGIVLREVKIMDIQIPVDERYNDAVNFLKPSINPILKNYFLTNFPFRDTIFKQLDKKANLKEFDYSTYEKETPSNNLYPFGYLGLTPLFVDSKYKDEHFDTEEEKQNYKKLFSLSSSGYKPPQTPTAKEEYFKQQMIDGYENYIYEQEKEREDEI